MTVAELIAKLQEYPPDTVVVVPESEFNYFTNAPFASIGYFGEARYYSDEWISEEGEDDDKIRGWVRAVAIQ